MRVWDLFILIQVVECTQTWPSKRGDEIFECAFDWIMAFCLFYFLNYVMCEDSVPRWLFDEATKFDFIVYSCLSVCGDQADEISNKFDFCLISFFWIRVRLHFYGFISMNFYGFVVLFLANQSTSCDCSKFVYGLQTENTRRKLVYCRWEDDGGVEIGFLTFSHFIWVQVSCPITIVSMSAGAQQAKCICCLHSRRCWLCCVQTPGRLHCRHIKLYVENMRWDITH